MLWVELQKTTRPKVQKLCEHFAWALCLQNTVSVSIHWMCIVQMELKSTDIVVLAYIWRFDYPRHGIPQSVVGCPVRMSCPIYEKPSLNEDYLGNGIISRSKWYNHCHMWWSPVCDIVSLTILGLSPVCHLKFPLLCSCLYVHSWKDWRCTTRT